MNDFHKKALKKSPKKVALSKKLSRIGWKAVIWLVVKESNIQTQKGKIVWHASAGIFKKSERIPVLWLDQKEVKELKEVLLFEMEGVGDKSAPSWDFFITDMSFQVVKPLSVFELELLKVKEKA